MLPILYTDTDQIRSVLGLSEKEMPDTRLTVRNLEKELEFDLNSWVSLHSTLVESVNMGTATSDEIKLVDAVFLYSTYFCAKLVVPSLQMAAIQSVGDGKNSLDRFQAVDWSQLIEQLSERLVFYKKVIAELLATMTSETTTIVSFKPFSLVSNNYDPVTGGL